MIYHYMYDHFGHSVGNSGIGVSSPLMNRSSDSFAENTCTYGYHLLYNLRYATSFKARDALLFSVIIFLALKGFKFLNLI